MKTRFYPHILFSLILVLLTTLPLTAQQSGDEVRVVPELEKNSILIGEQTVLKVSVVHDKSQPVHLVLPDHELVPGVEILGYSLADSTQVSDKINKMIYDVVLTSFDSAQYTLENIKALVGDSVYTAQEHPNLVVNTVHVDLDHPDQYNDIKANWKPKFVLMDYWYYFIPLIILILAAIGYFVWKKYGAKWFPAKPKGEEKAAEPMLDPYTEAIRAIDALKERKLVEKNMVKEYYTELTDILRRYLYRAYGIQTAEKTSSEILALYKTHLSDSEGVNKLRQIFYTADLAKFAKYKPDSNENITVLTTASYFIEESNERQERERAEASAQHSKVAESKEKKNASTNGSTADSSSKEPADPASIKARKEGEL